MSSQIIEIDIERIFLDVLNPRFPEDKVESERDALELLCNAENVLKLAQDIVEFELNPLDLIGVIKDGEPTEDFNHQNYIVVEGNRRICALKLFNDPEIAPSDKRKMYRQLSEKWKENKLGEELCEEPELREALSLAGKVSIAALGASVNLAESIFQATKESKSLIVSLLS